MHLLGYLVEQWVRVYNRNVSGLKATTLEGLHPAGMRAPQGCVEEVPSPHYSSHISSSPISIPSSCEGRSNSLQSWKENGYVTVQKASAQVTYSTGSNLGRGRK